jgi:hypothetical protein
MGGLRSAARFAHVCRTPRLPVDAHGCLVYNEETAAPAAGVSLARPTIHLSLAAALFLQLPGSAVVLLRAGDLWRQPYQVGRVWQSFDIARELERVHGKPWLTELSPMSGAPFVQEFPLSQYGMWFLRAATGLSIPEAGQAIALLTALASVAVWLLYAWGLPVGLPERIAAGALVFFVPGFLRYGATAVPDALVFLMNLSGVSLIFAGRRQGRDGLVTIGAALIGAAVLAKTTSLLPAAAIAVLLFAEKRRRAAIALVGATVPGVVWAAASRWINEAALPVNEFARVGNLREYWWNPHLYLDPWWYRTLAFTLYDVVGLAGLVAVWLAWTGRRRFEIAVLVGPAVATILAFPYHSASHGYYSLTWLAFSLVAGVELAAHGRRLSTAAMVGFATLLLAGVAERQIGLVERVVARRPEAVAPIVHLHPAGPDSRDLLARSALLEVTKKASRIAYLGSSATFLQSGIRGWFVETRDADSHIATRRHLPERVAAEEEWRKLSADWFRDRVGRGLDAVLIERGGPLDRPDVIAWARSAGLADAPQPPAGYVLLIRRF